jgi:hypothetical protein
VADEIKWVRYLNIDYIDANAVVGDICKFERNISIHLVRNGSSLSMFVRERSIGLAFWLPVGIMDHKDATAQYRKISCTLLRSLTSNTY